MTLMGLNVRLGVDGSSDVPALVELATKRGGCIICEEAFSHSRRKHTCAYVDAVGWCTLSAPTPKLLMRFSSCWRVPLCDRCVSLPLAPCLHVYRCCGGHVCDSCSPHRFSLHGLSDGTPVAAMTTPDAAEGSEKRSRVCVLCHRRLSATDGAMMVSALQSSV